MRGLEFPAGVVVAVHALPELFHLRTFSDFAAGRAAGVVPAAAQGGELFGGSVGQAPEGAEARPIRAVRAIKAAIRSAGIRQKDPRINPLSPYMII